MREDISGIQFYYQQKEGMQLEFLDDGSVCHICGGPLTKNHVSDTCSAKWTDEAICEGKASDQVCEACQWARTVEKWKKDENENLIERTKAGGYGNAWKLPEGSEDSKDVLAVTQKGVFHPHYKEFLEMICDDASYPAIFAISEDSNAKTRKHTTLFATKTMSYSKENCHIWYSGLSIASDTPYSGVVTVDAGDFAKDVCKIADGVKKYIDPCYEPNPKSTNKPLCRKINALCKLAQLRDKGIAEEERTFPYTDNEYLRDFIACSMAEGF